MLMTASGCAQRPDFGLGTVVINDKHTIVVEVAETHEQKSYGLMNIKSIEADEGMLFIYEGEQDITMWMKNTYVSLDILFIDKSGVITHIEKNTTPLSEKYLSSGYPTKYVLETRAGFANFRGIRPGHKIKFTQN